MSRGGTGPGAQNILGEILMELRENAKGKGMILPILEKTQEEGEDVLFSSGQNIAVTSTHSLYLFPCFSEIKLTTQMLFKRKCLMIVRKRVSEGCLKL